ncbi:MAG TPA: serine--tRNA ligase, partial [Actinobacteria bacterium]|nr:serine--tRNA ligase [Actinomycetota bacterium]
GTLVAIPRMIVAILENHQQSDGSVIIPKALQGLLGMERFTPVAN